RRTSDHDRPRARRSDRRLGPPQGRRGARILTHAESPAAPKSMSRASIGVAAFSTVVEWYDFTLYLYLATVLSRVFFGAAGTALNTTLGAFAIAYLLRPLGGIFFGHIGA